MAQSRLVGLTPGAAFLPPVLRAAVLEVSMAQIPRLRLLSTCPHCHADGNPHTHRVSSFSLLPGKTWLSSFPLEGRGDQLRGPGQESRPSVLESWARPLRHEKDLQGNSIQVPEFFWPWFWACLGSGSLPGFLSLCHPSLGPRLCLCPQVLKTEQVWYSRPRETGRPSKEAPWGGVGWEDSSALWVTAMWQESHPRSDPSISHSVQICPM